MNLQNEQQFEQRAIILAKVYQKERQKRGQAGYKAFYLEEEFLGTTLHKQLVTVCKWLHSKGWNVTLKEYHWQGYVASVFDFFDPSIPQAGQLKNEMLLRKYLKTGFTKAEPPVREMEETYRNVLRDEVSPNTVIHLLGLRDRNK